MKIQEFAEQMATYEPLFDTPKPVESRPALRIDTTRSCEHVLHFWDKESGESKSDDVDSVEVWCKLGPSAPVSADGYSFYCSTTRSPFVVEFEAGDSGETAHYIARWVNKRNEPGPWSQTVSATIGA